MSVEVKLPNLGDGIESGDVLDVLVSEGESVAKDQPILELETDKATVEVPSTHAGKVVKVHVASGQSIPIGATLITVEPESAEAQPAAPAEQPPAEEAPPQEAPATAETAAEPEPAPEPPAAEEPAAEAPQPSRPSAEPAPRPQPSRTPAAPQETAAPRAAQPAAGAADEGGGAVAAGPAIRRLAREVGIDLRNVQGSGAGGRITREDVLAAVRQSGATAQANAQRLAAESAPPPAAAPQAPTPGPSTGLSPEDTNDNWGPVQIEPMTKIRKTIAAKMHESWSAVPRVTNFDDADITELEEIRQASKADYASRGVKLTTMPFLIKAVALSLKANPSINAAIDEANGQLIYKQYVNIGIAVDTERGLVVPSLRRADQLSIPEIARSLALIASNVRKNSFTLDDLRGSTFTISNLGAIGGTYSTPIVNTPEVAILLIGRSRKMPVVVDDQIAARMMMPLSLSYDHRLVDGATAARFLNDVISYLESPSRLLIAP